MVTLADILEEIVGEFTTDPLDNDEEFIAETKNCYLVSGNANMRDLNKGLNWQVPSKGAKTLNGLILEHLGDIPKPGTQIKISNYSLEVMESDSNHVHSVRIRKL